MNFKPLAGGNIEMTMVITPDAYAALFRVRDESKVEPVDAVSLALMILPAVLQAAESGDASVREALADLKDGELRDR